MAMVFPNGVDMTTRGNKEGEDQTEKGRSMFEVVLPTYVYNI